MKSIGYFPGTWLCAAILLASAASGFGQNLVANGSFELPPVTNATKVEYPTNLAPWESTTTNFEIWTNGWKNPAAGLGPLDSADGHQNLEIISEGTNVAIWQTVPTLVGERYIFSFFYSPRPQSASDLFVVSINSNVCFSAIEDGDDLTNFNWQHFATNFVAKSNSTTIVFSDASLTGGGSGTHIDGVVLKHEPWLAISNAGPGYVLYWLGASNETYQLQSCTNLTGGGWSNVGGTVAGFDATNFVSTSPNTPQMFYRLMIEP
jgi:hypothetical protein